MRIAKICILFLLAGCTAKQRLPEALNDKASVQYQFAYEAFTQGNLIPGLSSALKAVDLAPNNPDVRNLLGLIYFRQEKFALAEASLKEAVLLEPKLSEGWNNLGTLYYELKRYDEAHHVLEKALENPLYLYPERIYNNLGLVEDALGNNKAAIAAYERSINLQREFYLSYQNLGKLYFNMGNHVKAKSLLQEASRLCTDCSEPRYFLGMTLMKRNETSEALKIFKQGAETDPRGYYGQLCQKYLVK